MSRPSPLLEVLGLFLRLGLTAFGGPAAHIAIMHDEVVKRRKWLSDQQFLDLLGATNLIPGPNSTEMAIHIGYLRAGWPGLILGGLGFILPAVGMVLGLAVLKAAGAGEARPVFDGTLPGTTISFTAVGPGTSTLGASSPSQYRLMTAMCTSPTSNE